MKSFMNDYRINSFILDFFETDTLISTHVVGLSQPQLKAAAVEAAEKETLKSGKMQEEFEGGDYGGYG